MQFRQGGNVGDPAITSASKNERQMNIWRNIDKNARNEEREEEIKEDREIHIVACFRPLAAACFRVPA